MLEINLLTQPNNETLVRSFNCCSNNPIDQNATEYNLRLVKNFGHALQVIRPKYINLILITLKTRIRCAG